jgi:hypothetical protein
MARRRPAVVIELVASGGSGHDRREGDAVNSVVALLLGLAALVVGAEMVVREGSALAGRFNVSPLVVGMTIVSLGTSLPELAIGLNAAADRGRPRERILGRKLRRQPVRFRAVSVGVSAADWQGRIRRRSRTTRRHGLPGRPGADGDHVT